MKKIGRNDPCPCGKLKPDGSPVKYKKCHEIIDFKAKAIKMTMTRANFITKPYTTCPNCGKKEFGVFISAGGTNSYSKECRVCGHAATYKLPEIRKKIIYLDQFVIDNIVKALDPKHPKHESVSKDPFWVQVFSKLDVLSRAHLVVCPDSFFHREESGPTNYFESMQRIYEHFSGGATFTNHMKIAENQILQTFDNYLKGKPETALDLNPENVVLGELNEWHGNMRISVNAKPKDDQVKEFTETKAKKYQSFTETFKRWQTEKHLKFDDWYKQETIGYAKGIMLSVANFYKKRASAPEKYLKEGKVDLNDFIPPFSLDIVNSLQRAAEKNGITNTQEILNKIGEFFLSPQFEQVPIVKIGSLIYASLADQAARGRISIPSPGVTDDVDMISSILPYSEAMLVDKENAAILLDPRVKKQLNYPTEIFSLRDRQAFLDYLDQILNEAEPEHIKFVEQIYGDNWKEPYLSILNEDS